MFEGEQFHQFIASRTSSSLPLPLSFPHQTLIPTFDHHPYLNPHQHQHQHQPNFHQQLHHHHQQQQQQHPKDHEEENSQLERDGERSAVTDPPWGEDEVVALLRIRSSMEGWFPDFTTWEHVSRKLGEIGYKRSGEKCKEKFEEESCCRNFNNNISFTTKNYRLFSELEQLCHGGENTPQIVSSQKNQDLENPNLNPNLVPQPTTEAAEHDAKVPTMKAAEHGAKALVPHQDASRNEVVGMEDDSVGKGKKNKKRKRKEKFEMLKGYCEKVVRKMIEHQEEWQRKVIEEMVRRDEEKIAREEEWKKKEMERINKEIEIRLNQQSVAGDTQSTIIQFLNNLTSSPHQRQQQQQHCNIPNTNPHNNLESPPNPPTSTTTTTSFSPIQPQTPNSTSHEVTNLDSPQNPSPISNEKEAKNPNSPNTQLSTFQKVHPNERPMEDMGKRWPREEVLALINLRSSFYNNNGDNNNNNHHQELGNTKGPLWERISLGMLEMGYKRSAKRCKEKWENINKYFRKTKDVHKKRPLDSRTCPYFHHLTTLYTQPSTALDPPENHPTAPENCSALPENNFPSAFQAASGEANASKNVPPPQPFDFEF